MIIENDALLQKVVDRLNNHDHFNLVIRSLSNAGHNANELIKICDLSIEVFTWAQYAYISNQKDEASREQVVSCLSNAVNKAYGIKLERARSLVEIAMNEINYSKRVQTVDRASICNISRQSYYNKKRAYDNAVRYARYRMIEWDLNIWLSIKPKLLA